jgi:hypothetical protein
MKLHTVFLREGCVLPDQFQICRDPYCKGWELAVGGVASELDANIRRAGWHFMWMTDSRSSHGFGSNPETAIHRALINALKRVNGRFNAAELGSIHITNCLGLKIAKVTLHARQIQRRTSLVLAEESRLQEVLAL